MPFLSPDLLAGQIPDADVFNDPVNMVDEDTYTPTLTASGGSPAAGASGFLTGFWQRIGRRVTVWIDINLEGAGVSLAGTSWRISLPFDADLSLHTAGILDAASDMVGSYFSRSDTASQSLVGVCLLSGTAEVIMYKNASNTSVGTADFTVDGRIKAIIHYVAAAAEF